MRVLFSTLLLVQAVLSNQSDILCCKQTSGFKQCKSACNKFVSQTEVNLRLRALKELPKFCPGHLTKLWRCLNETNPGTRQYLESKLPNKAGVCCLMTSTSKCRRDCLNGNKQALNTSCSDIHLISCVTRHDATANCCQGASKSCIKACKLLLASQPASKNNLLHRVKKNCKMGGRHVFECAKKHESTTKNPDGYKQLKCCSIVKDPVCRESCQKGHLIKNLQEAMDYLTKACGSPLGKKENNAMWNCFLKVEGPTEIPFSEETISPLTEMDGAKRHCCPKAASTNCFWLCVKMFKSRWSASQTYPEFDMKCAYQPSEVNLMNCLADVTKPCQLGCTGLNFCTNFNNRHTELFRSCDAKADSYAKSHMQHWSKGIINVPGMPILVQDIKKCLPDTWKAIACLLQIKPCSIKSHRSTICKSDCIEILQKCGNSSSYSNLKKVEEVCNKLSPNESNCISINSYLKPSKYKDVTDEVTHPCNPNPCEKNKMCDINRTCYAASLDGCEPHNCVPGCPLGDASNFLVRMGEYARVPVDSGREGCFRVCHCGGQSRLTSCTILNCVPRRDCPIKSQKELTKKEHGERFMVGCNFCACFAGELMCTKRQCLEPPSQIPDVETEGRPKRNQTPMFTGLPCGCDSKHNPVCASNGQTFPNLCIARCAGFKDSQPGSCESFDPCKNNPCSKGQRCLIDRKTCLTPTDSCNQYFCVQESSYCKDMQLEPVCDNEGQQHPNLCSIHFKGKQLAYKGFCKPYCSQPTKPLCGINGETYSSVCAATSSRVIVDYEGHCRAIGHQVVSISEGRCKDVKCPPLVPANCVGIHPPGACCPHCAAQIRILVSLTQLSINSEGLQDHYKPITLEHLLVALRRHVTTTECDLFGYQSIEGDLVILIKAITNKPTVLQIEACSLEAQRIEALINTGSPSFTSHVILSTLKAADTQTPSLSLRQTQASSTNHLHIPHLIICLLQTIIILKWSLRS
ncbi:reversion-inducing cysteine-rich protein with Kazal motifs-like isoform X2 [Actinia tenebrosa]|uniref:Reversion-inducing cysteine-rich protein with Kazal motifs-like isoform X2 n=1 Tax=Actinia tenebrosa TaxID=6105 RepID=A0A6P8IXM5_ACTTE|nr:reversion-inducing cysteine-rich protein with Kazal motifs-like isoform X2 [Actinia tenebrosa]